VSIIYNDGTYYKLETVFSCPEYRNLFSFFFLRNLSLETPNTDRSFELLFLCKLEKSYCAISFSSSLPVPQRPCNLINNLIFENSYFCSKFYVFLSDIHKKWWVPPAWNVEFVAYYQDRNQRITAHQVATGPFLNDICHFVLSCFEKRHMTRQRTLFVLCTV
jgi:hypothetical protein